MTKHSHYHKDVSNLKTIDVYRTLELFGVTDQALGHAIKKLLCAGKRGAGKPFEQDVREAVDTLNRRLQMLAEDDSPPMYAPAEAETQELCNEWLEWDGKAHMPVPVGIKVDIRDHDGDEHIGVISGDWTNEPQHWKYTKRNMASIVAWRRSTE